LNGQAGPHGLADVEWLTPSGEPKTPAHWEAPEGGAFAMALTDGSGLRLAVLFNRTRHAIGFRLPERPGHVWTGAAGGRIEIGARSVAYVAEALETAAQAT
jgi:pullulanase/glycogen debranching enzyme